LEALVSALSRLSTWIAALAVAAAGAPLAAWAADAPAGARSAATAASSRLDEIVARGTLRVGSTGDYKPFTYRVAGSERFIGLDIALAEELARSLGVRLQVVPTT